MDSKIKKVTDLLKPSSISLNGSRFKKGNKAFPFELPPELILQHKKIKASRPRIINIKDGENTFTIVLIEISLGTRAITRSESEENEGKRECLLSLEAEFAAQFVAGDELPDQADLEFFAEKNAPVLVWPYWRELVQSTFEKAGAPSPPMPFFHRAIDEDTADFEADPL